MRNELFLKNSKTVKLILTLFFACSLIIETTNRYHYSSELIFKFNQFEILLFILIILIWLNIKGIKIIVSFTYLLLIFLSTKHIFYHHSPTIPTTLLLKVIFNKLNLDVYLAYLLHLFLYFYFIYLMFKIRIKSNIKPN